MKQKLTDYDYESIDNLINLRLSAYRIYLNLIDLECKEQKDSKAFKGECESLKSLKRLENNIYERFSNDFETLNLMNLYLHLKDNNRSVEYASEESFLIINNLEKVCLKRVTKRVNNLLYSPGVILSHENPQSYVNKFLVDVPYQFLILNDAIIKDIYNTLLYYINEKLNTEITDQERRELLTLKYGFSLINENIENEFLKTNFTINDNLYWMANFVCEMQGMDIEEVKKLQMFIMKKETDIIIKEASKSFIIDFIKKSIYRIYILVYGNDGLNMFKEILDEKNVKMDDFINLISQDIQNLQIIRKVTK